MMKKNKKAWLRIVEAFIAVLIVMTVLVFIVSRQDIEHDISGEVYEKQRQILEVVSKDDGWREKILSWEEVNRNELVDFISERVPVNWVFAIEICELDAICPNPMSIYNKSVYSSEVIVTSNLTKYNPKKLRFFVWMK